MLCFWSTACNQTISPDENRFIPQGIHTGQPPEHASAHIPDSLPLVIGVSDSGDLIYQGKPFEALRLIDIMRTHITANHKGGVWDIDILIAADSMAPFGAVARLIMELRRMGCGKNKLLFEGEVIKTGKRLWPVTYLYAPGYLDAEEQFLLQKQGLELPLLDISMLDTASQKEVFPIPPVPSPLSTMNSQEFKRYFPIRSLGHEMVILGTEPDPQPISVIRDSLNALMYADSLFMSGEMVKNNLRPLLLMFPDSITAHDAVWIIDEINAMTYPRYLIETRWDEMLRREMYHIDFAPASSRKQ